MLWALVALRHANGWSWLRGASEGLRRAGEFRNTPRAAVLAKILSESEREILVTTNECGPSIYWTLYFLLTGGGAK